MSINDYFPTPASDSTLFPLTHFFLSPHSFLSLPPPKALSISPSLTHLHRPFYLSLPLQTSPRRMTHFIFLRQTTTSALLSARSSLRTPAEPSSSSSCRRTPPLHQAQQFKVIKDHTDFKVVEYYRDKGVENWTVECWEKDFSKPQNQKYFKPSSSKTLFIENPLDSLSVSRQHKTKLRYQVQKVENLDNQQRYYVHYLDF